MGNTTLDDEEESKSTSNKKCKCTKPSLPKVLFCINLTFITIILIEVLIILYFTICGIVFLNLYYFVYQWISLLTKNAFHMIISIFSNFSDFGLFFILTLVSAFLVQNYTEIIETVFLIYYKLIKFNQVSKNIRIRVMWIELTIEVVIIIILLVFIIKLLFYSAVIFECLILASICFGRIFSNIKKFILKKCQNPVQENENQTKNPFEPSSNEESIENSENENSIEIQESENSNNIQKVESQSENNNDNNENVSEDFTNGIIADDIFLSIIKKFIEQWNKNIFLIAFFDGMFYQPKNQNEQLKIRFPKHQMSYKILISLIILGFQFYSLFNPFFTGTITIGEFFTFLVVKTVYCTKILAFNLIDIVFNKRRVIKSLKQNFLAKYVFYFVIFLYFAICVAFLVILTISKISVIFPTIDNLNYIEDNSKWFRLGKNQTITPESFCFTQAQKDGSLKTEDFAMLVTLPRLYDVTKYGKCYIKPSMRGMFNSTMKYIFGKDYEKDCIYILCKSLTHYPFLIISSDKILKQTLTHFPDNKITFLEKQFNIENKNYFEHFSTENLTEKGKLIYKSYEDCVSLKNSENCEEIWDNFTQYYWPNIHSSEYEDIPGFERYQISIDADMIIQPSFITEDGELWAGTHYIIGGTYEDSWSVGFFIETIVRYYIPIFLDNFIPLYSLIRSLLTDVFLRIEWFNKHFFYFDVSSSKEMESIVSLYSIFNFSHQSIFVIGHTISGTSFKGVSFLTDIQGITFEASGGENYVKFIDKSDLKKMGESKSQITNIYSAETIFSGNDENCDVNGALPKKFNLPSVYDTACLTSMVCSDTRKYVPFCMQAMTRLKKDPVKEFNSTYDAYLNFYGYHVDDL